MNATNCDKMVRHPRLSFMWIPECYADGRRKFDYHKERYLADINRRRACIFYLSLTALAVMIAWGIYERNYGDIKIYQLCWFLSIFLTCMWGLLKRSWRTRFIPRCAHSLIIRRLNSGTWEHEMFVAGYALLCIPIAELLLVTNMITLEMGYGRVALVMFIIPTCLSLSEDIWMRMLFLTQHVPYFITH